MFLNDPRFDLPEFDGRAIDYMICSTPRSGSTLLGYLLLQCNLMGVPHEYLHPTVHLPVLARRNGLIRPNRTVDIENYLVWLHRHRSTANGVFGLKAHFEQISPVAHLSAVVSLIEGSRLIRIRRRDLVLQAISYATAFKTGVWASNDVSAGTVVPTPDYDEQLIEKCVSAILRQDAGWNKLFERKGLTSLDIWYEDLIAAPDSICRSVCNHVGIEPACTFDLTAVPIERQSSSSRAEEWKQRFSAEHQGLVQRLASMAR